MPILDDKVAIVTGGARGIGRATAELLIEHGASVLIADLDDDAVAATAKELGDRAVAYSGDLTRPDVPERVVNAAVEAFGKLDILVNNAGYTWDGVIHRMPDEQFVAMFEVHMQTPFRLLRAAAPFLREPAKRERENGEEVFRKVVNVASISGTMGNAGQVNYSSAKAGLVGLTKTVAKEWARFRINVNAVAPGTVATRLNAPREEGSETFTAGERSIELGIPGAIRERAIAKIPFERPAMPHEVAGCIFFLCSPWSNFVQGQVLTVTGGQMEGMTG